MRRIFWILFGCLLLPQVHAASFDCTKAGTSIEKMICGNTEISQLDSDLSAAYKQAIERGDDKQGLVQRQKQWLREVRNTCTDATCLTRAYIARLQELKPLAPSPTTAYARGWISTTPGGPDQKLSKLLLDRLQQSDSHCLGTAIDGYPEFVSPPWQALDASQHLELIAKIIGYEGNPYANIGRPWSMWTNQEQSAAIQAAKEFVKAGGTLKIWRTRLLAFFDSRGYSPVPPGDQTVVLLSWKLVNQYCPSDALMMRHATSLVLPDLSGPDPHVDLPTAGLLATSYPVLYKGNTLFISYDNGFTGFGEDEIKDGARITIYQNLDAADISPPESVTVVRLSFWYDGKSHNSGAK